MKKLPLYLAAVSILLSVNTLTHAQVTSTWQGDESTSWNTAGNWDNSDIPASGSETAIFDVTGNQNNQPNMDVDVDSAIQFDNAGWSITGTSDINFKSGGNGITNNATSGVNSVKVAEIRNNSSSDVGVYINAAGVGGTLVLGAMDRNATWSILGGGTIILDGADNTAGTIATDFSSFSGSLLTNSTGEFVSSTNNDTIGSNASGSTVGGIGTLKGRNFGTTFIEGTLAAGGNGSYIADKIGDLTLTSAGTSRADFTMVTGSTFAVDIGTGGVGDNDRLLFDLNNGGNIAIESGVTLSIIGTTIQDGTYTIATEIGGDSHPIIGTFDTVLFNGSAIDPSKFTVNYGADAITLDITGVVPEPSTYALIAGCFALTGVMLRRRR
jgi:hypothetical protein|tara:strand:- start:12568 stop:13713 length:1146 start_codon:yes stop_codon:yes gene_type:complete